MDDINPSQTNPNISDPLNSQDPITSPPTEFKATKSKAVIFILSIVAILSLATAIVFAYLYFTGQSSSSEPNVTTSPTNESDIDTSVNDESNRVATKEIEITDAYILRDLDEKMAILHGVSTKGSTMVVGGIDMSGMLYSEGNYSDIIKLTRIVEALLDNTRYLTTEEQKTIAVEYDSPEYERVVIDFSQLHAIDANLVAQKYEALFGEPLAREGSRTKCPSYLYNLEYDIYYQDPNGGCGGYSPFTIYHYKNAYTAKDEYAYVYVSAAASSLNGYDMNIYCDVIPLNDDSEPCQILPKDSDFTVDSTNYQDFAQYRFVFKKADSGTYYFVQVEKV